MNRIIYNKSKTYLLPLLSEEVELDKRFYSFLKDTYIFDNLNIYKNCIYILHDFNFRNPEFTSYEHKLINNDLFLDLVDIDDKVLYIYKFPKQYMFEYEKFKEGKYSQFGEDSKKLIINFFVNIYKNDPNAIGFLVKLKQVLYKDKILKQKIEKELGVTLDDNAELTDLISINNETFNLLPYKDNIKGKIIKIDNKE